MDFDQKIFDLCDLLHGSLTRTLTPEQQQQLDSWLDASPGNRELWEELQQPSLVQQELQFFQQLELEAAWEKIAAATGWEGTEVLHGSVEKPQLPVAMQPIPSAAPASRYWWAAAAVLVLAVTAALWLQKPSHTVVPAIAAVTDTITNTIPPGSNKATLLLADGKVVTLNDSGVVTPLKEADGTTISGGTGQLVYDNAGTNGAVLWNTLQTPRGGQFQVVLPDGSKVWLNAASSLKYPTRFTGSSRQVFLNGEAYFDIATDAQHPFIVKTTTHPLDITVLGTGFNVNAYTAETAIVTLVHGAVQVQSGKQVSRLQRGEQALLTAGGSLESGAGDVETAIAWKNGMFSFEQADMVNIMQQVARWYDIEVVFAGKVPSRRFSGRIRRQATLPQLIQMLELVTHAKFTVTGRKVTVQ